jgi:hypothetical protein
VVVVEVVVVVVEVLVCGQDHTVTKEFSTRGTSWSRYLITV